jgi:hypothetical protein
MFVSRLQSTGTYGLYASPVRRKTVPYGGCGGGIGPCVLQPELCGYARRLGVSRGGSRY